MLYVNIDPVVNAWTENTIDVILNMYVLNRIRIETLRVMFWNTDLKKDQSVSYALYNL